MNEWPNSCTHKGCTTPAIHEVKTSRLTHYLCTKHRMLLDGKGNANKLRVFMLEDKERIDSELFFAKMPFGEIAGNRELSFSEKLDLIS